MARVKLVWRIPIVACVLAGIVAMMPAEAGRVGPVPALPGADALSSR